MIFRVVGLCLMCELVLVGVGVVCVFMGVWVVLMVRGRWLGVLGVIVW